MDKFDDSWYAAMGRVIMRRGLSDISEALEEERETKTVLPPLGSDLMFKAFELVPLKKVKVVILGQDPYHDGSYNGLAFGNGLPGAPSKKISPSLRKVIAEAEQNFSGKVDPTLYSWARQGVLLINTAHTVVKGDAGSHLNIWNAFTDTIVDAINTVPEIVWMLWGAKAHEFRSQILNDTHHIITSGHPSPLNRTNPFDGECFVECNEKLVEWGKSIINWTK